MKQRPDVSAELTASGWRLIASEQRLRISGPIPAVVAVDLAF
ncbi:MAG: hypothetical protein R2748_17150 [Bryobacterales bacterium]